MFFDEEICVTGTRDGGIRIAVTLPACVVDDGTGDPLSPSAPATECVNVCAYFKRDDWPEVIPPQMGDVVDLDDCKFAVKRVTRLADCYCVSARKV